MAATFLRRQSDAELRVWHVTPRMDADDDNLDDWFASVATSQSIYSLCGLVEQSDLDRGALALSIRRL